jgi:uncharacterized protein YdhG (YjbR/CyaY superfamily)
MSDTQRSGRTHEGFSADERAAMKERAKEVKAESRRGSRTAKNAADGESEVLAKIAEMTETDRAMAERIHAVVTAAGLSPTTWYGMPAYARDGKTVCFFQPAKKFKTRYATLGFSDNAKLDDGGMWPNAYALTKVTKTEEARIAALVKQAMS